MKYFILKKYIDKLTLEDIKNFAYNNNISLTKEETNDSFYFIKNNWQKILDNDDVAICEIRKKFDSNKAKKIEQLYFEYKQKYQKFLK